MPQILNLQERVKAAWGKLPNDLKARLEPQILIAHQHLLNVRGEAVPAMTEQTHRELTMVYSLLHDDPHGLLESAAQPRVEDILTSVGPDGVVYFGGLDYDGSDPGWAYVIVALAETLGLRPPFPSAGQVIQIPDDATFAVLGDWGGGNPLAQSVAAAVTASAPPGDELLHSSWRRLLCRHERRGHSRPVRDDEFPQWLARRERSFVRPQFKP
jgi:hypothetical protein